MQTIYNKYGIFIQNTVFEVKICQCFIKQNILSKNLNKKFKQFKIKYK